MKIFATAIIALMSIFAGSVCADQLTIANNNPGKILLFGNSSISNLFVTWPISVESQQPWVRSFDHPATFGEIDFTRLAEMQPDGTMKELNIQNLCHVKFGDIYNAHKQTLTLIVNNNDVVCKVTNDPGIG